MILRKRLLATALLAAAGLIPASAAVAVDAVPTGPLPCDVVPTLVHLELRLDPKQARFSGSTRIEATVAKATSTIWMHGRDLAIGKAAAVLADGTRIALSSASADASGVLKLTSTTPIPAGKATIEIAYQAPFGQLQGAYRVKPDGRDYVVTQMEPLGARTAFPGFDEPSFKQPWEITLIVPQDEVAVANTAETKTERLPDGFKKVSFARSEALPSYLIAFAVGPWDVAPGPAIPANPNAGRSAPIVLRGIAAQGQGKRMAYSLKNTPQIVTALEDYFGTPYPFDKLDNVAAPDFWAGAMENAGLIVYRDTLMFPDETSAVGRRQGFWGVSAHELAHQWFGDLVTMRWWDDLWLNEGFATWMANKIHGQLQPEAHTDRTLLEGALGAMNADSLSTTRRIHEPIRDYTDIQSAFDGITYQKGGATLNMFEQYIGATKFRDGIRSYLRDHARGNATSADLIAAVAKQSDDPQGVSKAFFSFIDQPGVPFAKVDLDCKAGAKPALSVQQQRYLPIGSTAKAEQTWGIPMCVRYGDGGTVRRQCGLVSGKQARLELTEATSCPTWVMPNAHGAGYYRFALTPTLQQSLSGAFASLDEREQRVYADSITAAYNAGELTPTQLVAALPQFASAPVRQTATAGTREIGWMDEHLFANDAARAEFRGRVATIYRPRLQQLGMDFNTDDKDDTRLLRAQMIRFFTNTLRDDTVRSALRTQGRAVLGLGSDKALKLDAAPRDIRDLALEVAVQDGGVEAFDLAERHLRATQDAELRGQLLGALGSARDPALAARARALVMEPGLLRRNEIADVLEPQTDDAATRTAMRAWLDTNFSDLEARLAPAGARLLSAYASGMCSAADAKDLEAKFATRMTSVEGGPRALKQAVESTNLCAAQVAARKAQPPMLATR